MLAVLNGVGLMPMLLGVDDRRNGNCRSTMSFVAFGDYVDRAMTHAPTGRARTLRDSICKYLDAKGPRGDHRCNRL